MRFAWHGNEMLCTVGALCCVAKCFEILSKSEYKAGVGMRLCTYGVSFDGYTPDILLMYVRLLQYQMGGLAAM
jgi:hypothetical protein